MQLALVMIVRDEARCLRRCLESARPFVDEMIVVYTGSTDATVEIAQSAGARVEHFVWCDDFSAARNASLQHSDADWNLILDADNWLVSAPALMDKTALRARDFIGAVLIESGFAGSSGEEVSAAFEARLLPRGIRYEGRIHEQPASSLPRRRVDITLGHDGYQPAQLTRKGDRNETLLMQALHADAGNTYLWYQLAREYQVANRADAALIAFTEALRLSDGEEPYRHSLVVRALQTMTTAGALDQALVLADIERATWSNSPDFHFSIGALYLECASQDQANALGRWLPLAETAWRRCLEIGERHDLAGSVRGRGGHMAAHNLAALFATFWARYRSGALRSSGDDIESGRLAASARAGRAAQSPARPPPAPPLARSILRRRSVRSPRCARAPGLQPSGSGHRRCGSPAPSAVEPAQSAIALARSSAPPPGGRPARCRDRHRSGALPPPPRPWSSAAKPVRAQMHVEDRGDLEQQAQ